jgi:hypothetical protein
LNGQGRCWPAEADDAIESVEQLHCECQHSYSDAEPDDFVEQRGGPYPAG